MFRRNESAEEQWAAIDSILADGLWPQPETVGKYSENPHAVFFVADAPPGSGERRYSEYASWITADLPFKVYDRSRRGDLVEYRGKILLDMLRNVAELRPGSVGAVTGIPPEFIVGINGCPVALFDAAISRWGRW
jgi:hypothetical protein